MVYVIYHTVKANSAWLTIIVVMFFVGLILTEFIDYQNLLEKKEMYDTIWMQRKNPEVYQIVKEYCEEIWDSMYEIRAVAITTNIVLMGLFAWWGHVIAPLYIFAIARQYMPYIFDFDEPDKKEKEKREALTEVAAAAWRSLVGVLTPAKAS